MNNFLKKLNQSLKDNYLHKESQEITELEEYSEPWHKEVIDELEQEEKKKLQDLEDKYTYTNSLDVLNNINDSFKDIEDFSSFRFYLEEAEIIQKILLQEGFKPLDQSKNFVAGKGAFGVVLRGIYQGKPAVIKIEQSAIRPVVKEINNWNDILKLKNTMPPEYKKHIPDIYKINSGKVKSERIDIYYSVIIMEELFKLSKDLNDFLTRHGINFIKSVESKLKEPESIYNLASSIYKIINKNYKLYDLKLPSINEIFKNLNQFSNLNEDHYNVATSICQMIKNKNINIDDFTIEDLNRDILYEITSYFSQSINFPISYQFFDNLEQSTWGSFPETKSLLECLIYIKNNIGLSWKDLHTGNIMMDRDGNLKIIDVGLYDNFKNSKMNNSLKVLAKTLKNSGYIKLAQEIEDLEDLDEEFFDSDPISEDDYLKKIHPIGHKEFYNKMHSHPNYEINAFPNILKKENFHPVEAGGKSFIAGKGSYGTVFRGVYQGKPAVAKVILYEDGIKEVNNWNDIINSSNSVVPGLKKYLPKIYKLNYQKSSNTINVNDFWEKAVVPDPENNYAIVIMEELIPLDNHLLTKIVNVNSWTSDKKVYKDPNFLWDIAQELTKAIQNYSDEDLNQLDLLNKIFKILMNIDFNSPDPAKTYIKVIEQFKEEFDKLNTGLVTLPRSVENIFYKTLNPILPESINIETDISYFKHLPETSGFITALEDLADLTGLKWDDLVAPRNLMMDRDGQLKLIDPGLYGY